MLKPTAIILLLVACAWAAPKPEKLDLSNSQKSLHYLNKQFLANQKQHKLAELSASHKSVASFVKKASEAHKEAVPAAPVQIRDEKKQEKAAPLVVGEKLDDDWTPPLLSTTLKIGTPQVDFKLQVDLDFNNILLVGPKCTTLACKGNNIKRTIYNPQKSTTYKDQGVPVKERYGTPVTGEYYSDSIEVDGIKDTDVAFAVLTTASQQFYNVPYDGVFGLDFLGNTRSSKNFPSPVNSILKSSDKKIVNLWFNKATKNADRYGTVTFGKLNTDKCNTGVQYLKVDDFDFSFIVQKVRFGKLVAHREERAVIDPTQRMIGLPTTIYNDLLRIAGASSSSQSFYCSDIKDVTFDIKIGGNFYSLDTSDFIIKSGISTSYCTFLAYDTGDDFNSGYVLGEPFLRRNCVTYDVDNQQIGFSSAK